MTNAQAALAQVREALAAGPTPGPRFQGRSPHAYCVYDKQCWHAPDGSRHGDTPNLVITVSPDDAEADAQFIAACSPANIAAIIAHVEAQEAEIERLRKMLCQCDMRTRLVGDGCEFCNPTLADELAKEQR